MSRMRRPFVTTLVVVAAQGCASFGPPGIPVVTSGWTREELRSPPFSWACQPADCNRKWRTSRGPIVLRTRAKNHGLHEIPGWNTQSTTGRVMGGLLMGVLRRQGLTTDRVQVGVGTRTISDSGDTAWELRCSVYWIDDQEEEYDKDKDDHVVSSVRRSEGAACRVVDLADTAQVRWRFTAGIAPPRDSLAARYDSIRAVNAVLVGAVPPMSLERVGPEGAIEQRYDVVPDTVRSYTTGSLVAHHFTVSRDSATPPIAGIHTEPTVGLDYASEATPEEVRALRLLTALLAVSFKGG